MKVQNISVASKIHSRKGKKLTVVIVQIMTPQYLMWFPNAFTLAKVSQIITALRMTDKDLH